VSRHRRGVGRGDRARARSRDGHGYPARRMTLPGRLVLLGHPVAHSLSPRFQNAALTAAGIPLVYEAIDVAPELLDETLRVLVASQAAGNVTIPHKEAVYALCTRRTPVADRVGAVNTF